ncbi:ribonuclease H-like domain-containing protein [Paenibacillus athensensis]|uniref:YprB ribonuclease H-like domain-containing protein n=1 Tax=Paenibacillus athensensis TaxID=1967502 RepID=A0A4Y8QAR8_9BACL|nr:ribonuclease H-like domain-containing protein [Paenibacillus athensensis]MCD1257466.1 ribonuclease H-like domain-containing protein [Paenibacillus athensensis]
MSRLRERLVRFHKSEEADKPQLAPPPDDGGEWARVGAELYTSPWGSFVRRRRAYGPDSRHGRHRLRELADVAAELSAFGSDDAPAVRAESLLFFDTETTGLGVGAGNVPFMVGIGYVELDTFVVEQLLMRNPAEEVAMLRYLQALMGRFTHMVSYNGRTFDWPIVQSRFVLNRLELDDSELEQLDFLYPSRSLWRYVLPSCRLSSVEEGRLGFERLNDVPGSMAPALYFQYLADKDPAVLEGVFIHNEHDIVSMAALAIHLGKWLGGHFTGSGGEEQVSNELGGMGADELYRTGAWLDKMGRSELSRYVLDYLYSRLGANTDSPAGCEEGLMPVCETDDQAAIHAKTLLLLAGFYKKAGAYERAAALWQRYVQTGGGGLGIALEPYIELSMHYEHREKQLRLALHYADEAWQRLQRRRTLQRGDRSKLAEEEAALRKRLERLRKKLDKLAVRSGKPARRPAVGASNGQMLDISNGGPAIDDRQGAPQGTPLPANPAGKRSNQAADPLCGDNTAGITVPDEQAGGASPARTAKPRRSKPVYAMDSLI